MQKVIERMWIHVFPHCFGPLLIADFDVSDGPAQRARDVVRAGGLGDQIIGTNASVDVTSQHTYCHTRNILGSYQRDHRVSRAPRQKYRIVVHDTSGDQRPHVLEEGWRIQMHRTDPRPIKHTVPQPVL